MKYKVRFDNIKKEADANLGTAGKLALEIREMNLRLSDEARLIEKAHNGLAELDAKIADVERSLIEYEEELLEKIRIESDRYDRIRRSGSKPALAMNNVEMIAARLVYLKTVEEACRENGYANLSEVKRNLDDKVIDMAAGPIMQSKGFSEVVKKSSADKLKESFEQMGRKKPVKNTEKKKDVNRGVNNL